MLVDSGIGSSRCARINRAPADDLLDVGAGATLDPSEDDIVALFAPIGQAALFEEQRKL